MGLPALVDTSNQCMCNNINTCLVVAMYQDNAQVGWLQLPPILYCHIVPLADVVYVDGDAGVST